MVEAVVKGAAAVCSRGELGVIRNKEGAEKERKKKERRRKKKEEEGRKKEEKEGSGRRGSGGDGGVVDLLWQRSVLEGSLGVERRLWRRSCGGRGDGGGAVLWWFR
jgi:hypothetical protein